MVARIAFILLTSTLIISSSGYCYSFNNNISENSTSDTIQKPNSNFKSLIAPTALIATGTALHFSTKTKENFRDFAQKKFPYHGHLDDYLQYAPAAMVYGLNAVGIKGKNNFGNRTALVLKSFFLNDFITYRLKTWTDVERPNGADGSFPSAHTSVAFSMAHYMHKEYGENSIWYSIGAYSCAATVGIMRTAKNAHWVSDIIVGAGIGILSTELVYLTHLYKWDKEHLKNWDILPFKLGRQKGVTLVYNF